jgi:hypothetical protein
MPAFISSPGCVSWASRSPASAGCGGACDGGAGATGACGSSAHAAGSAAYAMRARGAGAAGTVIVWVSQAGQLTDPPLRHAEVVSGAELAAVLAITGLATVLLVASCLAHLARDRRMLAAWEAAWLASGPPCKTCGSRAPSRRAPR